MTDPDRTLGRVVMVMPTYNEAANLEWIVGRLREAQPGVDVLVVDDGSPDGTGAIADRLAAADPQVTVVHRAQKEGLGAAYRHGFEVALDAGYDVIGEMDADGSHQPEQLHRLLDALARRRPGHRVTLDRRRLGGQLAAPARGALARWQPLRPAPARHPGARRHGRVPGVPPSHAGEDRPRAPCSSTGYVFQTDMAYRTLQAGLRVVEVPIEFVERVRGDSKMTGAVARESLQRITRWGLRERLLQVRRLRPDGRGADEPR